MDPFDGIGSTGYQAIKMHRKHVGIELKEKYFQIACQNLCNAEKETDENQNNISLFDMVGGSR